MPIHDFASQRMFVEGPIAEDRAIPLDRAQSNYLVSVLRLSAGDEILIFNGLDGEWRAKLAVEGRKSAALHPLDRVRPQPPRSSLTYLFAPLKQARQDYMVQKAVEMGVGALWPVRTERTQVSRVNDDRLRANAIEAAEQCGILSLPTLHGLTALPDALAGLEPDALLIFCDEDAEVADPSAALSPFAGGEGQIALLVGPEGGFSPRERAAISARPRHVRLSLGPRILRADTAAVAALAIIQATLGDWCASTRCEGP